MAVFTFFIPVSLDPVIKLDVLSIKQITAIYGKNLFEKPPTYWLTNSIAAYLNKRFLPIHIQNMNKYVYVISLKNLGLINNVPILNIGGKIGGLPAQVWKNKHVFLLQLLSDFKWRSNFEHSIKKIVKIAIIIIIMYSKTKKTHILEFYVNFLTGYQFRNQKFILFYR